MYIKNAIYYFAMSTKLISVKQFREKFTSLWKEASEKNIRFIVLWHSKPVLKVIPIGKGDLLAKLKKEIAAARKHAKQDKIFTEERIMKEFGIL